MAGPIHTPHQGSNPATEEEILQEFRREGLSPHSWSNGPGDRYAPHSHSYHKVLYCVRGSISFRVETGNEEIQLLPGHRLEVPPGILHSAVIGPDGVTCLEAAQRK